MDLPEMQRRFIVEQGQAGAEAATAVARDWYGRLWSYLQQGPEGLSWLCFVGGLVTFALGFLGALNFFYLVLDPMFYTINAFQMMFGLCTCVIEVPPDWMEKSAALKRAQGFILQFAKFLQTFGGRGLFYIFQGFLMLSIAGVSLEFVPAIYLCVIGLLCIATQYGYDMDAGGPRQARVEHKPAAEPPHDSYVRLVP